MTSVDTFLGLTSLGAKPDMEQVNNAIKMDDPYEVVRMFCEASGMGREDFTASFVAPHEYSFFISWVIVLSIGQSSMSGGTRERSITGLFAPHRSAPHRGGSFRPDASCG